MRASIASIASITSILTLAVCAGGSSCSLFMRTCQRTVRDRDYDIAITADAMCALYKKTSDGNPTLHGDDCAPCGNSSVTWCQIQEYPEITPHAPGTRGTCAETQKKAMFTLTCVEDHDETHYGVSQCGGDGLSLPGRRPAGLDAANPPRDETIDVGAYFARCAYFEEASIEAFCILRAELRMHDAPASLVRAATRAAADERRHARTMGALAARFGATPERAVVSRRRVRALLDIAVENAVEGVVGETFSAAVALWGAQRSRDARVRAALRRIARDETAHADLALAVAKWARTRLDARERLAVDEAMRSAVTRVRRASASESEMSADVRAIAGMPSREESARMLDVLERELWSRSAA